MNKATKETIGAWVWTLALAGGFIWAFRRMTANGMARAQNPLSGGSPAEAIAAEADITGGETPNVSTLQEQWTTIMLGSYN